MGDDKFFNEEITPYEKLNILKIINFNIVYPSCYNFILEYLGIYDNNVFDSDAIEKLCLSCFRLTINYDYVVKYTQHELAIIAIQLLDIDNNLKKLPRLITEDIKIQIDKTYLNKFKDEDN